MQLQKFHHNLCPNSTDLVLVLYDCSEMSGSVASTRVEVNTISSLDVFQEIRSQAVLFKVVNVTFEVCVII